MTAKKKILVVQRRLTHYRVPFFEALRTALQDKGCELVLAHGSPTKQEMTKGDEGVLPWAKQLSTLYALNGRICWQPFGTLIDDASMIVITHENKLIYNLHVQFQRREVRVALWGHGANFQGDPNSLRERFKRHVAKEADWWFAYTQMSVPLVVKSGFPEQRITVLDNAVDTTTLTEMFNAVTEQERTTFRTEVGIVGRHVGIFVGSMYFEKRIAFLLEALTDIRAQVKDFEFLFVGSGPELPIVLNFCERNRWAKHLGVLKQKRKILAVSLASVMLNPGLVGLGILDSFVCKVPMVTTDCGLHSPEIAYLEDGGNGLMTRNALEDYVPAVVDLLSRPELLRQLQAGCERSAGRYTVSNMAEKFSDGAIACLRAPLLRGSQ